LLSVAHSFSTFVGPICAGALIDHASMHAAFAVLGTLPLAALWATRYMPDDAAPPPPRAAVVQRGPAWELLSAPELRRLIAVNLCLASSWDVHLFAVPILGHQHGFSASAIASVLASFALAVAAIRVALPALAKRYGEAALLRAALLVVACTFAIYPYASSLWTMRACAVALGFALGTSQPMVMTMLHQITPASRHGEAIALRSMFIYGSGIAVPLGFGAAAPWVGIASLFWMMAGLAAGGTFISLRSR
jgi:predicted MFS family arabinose efflux permease